MPAIMEFRTYILCDVLFKVLTSNHISDTVESGEESGESEESSIMTRSKNIDQKGRSVTNTITLVTSFSHLHFSRLPGFCYYFTVPLTTLLHLYCSTELVRESRVRKNVRDKKVMGNGNY